MGASRASPVSLKAGRIEGELKVAESLADSASNPGHAGDDPSRRDFIHIVAAAAAVGGAAAVAWPLIDQMNPAADTLALASVEFDLSKVELGQEVTIAWRKQPLFIRHRTPKEIADAVAGDHADLKDPQTDADRVKAGHAEWLILLGSCTHLGCVPLFGQGEYGGAFQLATGLDLSDPPLDAKVLKAAAQILGKEAVKGGHGKAKGKGRGAGKARKAAKSGAKASGKTGKAPSTKGRGAKAGAATPP